ncbi:hypothetical protein ACYPKM_04115 [Pseudomonas aeruginosa]
MAGAFEIEIKGFYGGNDVTDDMIVWVVAHSKKQVLEAIEPVKHLVNGVNKLPNDYMAPDSGIDYILLDGGSTAQLLEQIRSEAIEFVPGSLAALEANDDVVVWDEDKGFIHVNKSPMDYFKSRKAGPSEFEQKLLTMYGYEGQLPKQGKWDRSPSP